MKTFKVLLHELRDNDGPPTQWIGGVPKPNEQFRWKLTCHVLNSRPHGSAIGLSSHINGWSGDRNELTRDLHNAVIQSSEQIETYDDNHLVLECYARITDVHNGHIAEEKWRQEVAIK